MKQLEKDLQAVLKSLKQATAKTGTMMKRLEDIEKAKGPKKPKAKASPKAKAPKKASDSDTVLKIIRRSKKGVNRAAVIEKTGFEGRKVGDILYRLKKHGKIKVEGKGIYVNA